MSVEISRRQLLLSASAVLALKQARPGRAKRSPKMTTEIVLVHGAWHTELCWEPLRAALTKLGHQSQSLTLPSSAQQGVESDSSLPGIAEDVAAVTRLLDKINRPVLLVGHSYGGVVVSGAGSHPNVRHLLYLAAFCLEPGETAFDLAAGNPPPLTAQAVAIADDIISIKPELAAATFYGDLPIKEAQRWAQQLVPSTLSIFTTPTTSTPAWKNTPTTYAVCTDDRAISPDRQQFMARRATSDVIELPTSHSPFLSQPQQVAAIIDQRARNLT
jgi:pimeloyl-ACP methyl ester carboxylesterase